MLSLITKIGILLLYRDFSSTSYSAIEESIVDSDSGQNSALDTRN
jgi:hypothetical protein